MATDVDLQKLVVQLEASFVKYERQWSKAMGVTDANVKRTQSQFDRMAKVVSTGGANAAKGLSPVSFQTANIASQFQDIAVQLQAGQSPFTIALQQGTQLSAALGTGRGLRGTVAALGSAFGSLVSPVSLATIALITAGGFAVQYFGTLLQDGQASESTLKEQEDLIRRVADRWGDAVPALRAYVEQLDRLKDQSELSQATDLAIDEVYAKIVSTIRDQLRPELAAARIDIQQLGGDAQEIDQLQAAFDALVRKAEDGTASGADLEAIISLLANSSVGTTSIMQALQSVMAALKVEFDQAAAAARGFEEDKRRALQQGPATELFTANRDFVAEQERLNSLTAEQLALETEIERVKAEASRDKVVISEEQALSLAQQRLAAEERRAQIKAGEKAGSKAETEAQREAQAVLELIAALEHEYDLLGLTAQQQEVANALRRAGSAATAEQRAQIEDLVNKTYEEREQIEALNDLYAEFGQAGKTAVMGIVDALKDGKIEASELGDILSNVLGQFGQFFLNQAFGSFGGSGGGGNVLGALFGGKRAAGGPVDAGKAYLVGERGPEIIVPGRSGTVVPNHQLGGAGVSINIDARGAQMGVAEQIEARLKHWSRFEAPPLIRHHARTTMPENG